MFSELGRWYETTQTDPRAVALYERHYSNRGGDHYRRGICGPGESMILVTPAGDALYAWQRTMWMGKAAPAPWFGGVMCTVFRNESPHQSSQLIEEAVVLARTRWPQDRLYTTVNPSKIRSVNPGYCFKAAGWKRCAETLGGLVVLELNGD